MSALPEIVVDAAFLDPLVDPADPDLHPFRLARAAFAGSAGALTVEDQRGLAWVASAGSTWWRDGAGRAYRATPAAAAWHQAWVDVGTPNHVVSARFPVLPTTAAGLVARLADAANHYHVSVRPTSVELYKVVAGVRTSLGLVVGGRWAPAAGTG